MEKVMALSLDCFPLPVPGSLPLICLRPLASAGVMQAVTFDTSQAAAHTYLGGEAGGILSIGNDITLSFPFLKGTIP